MARKLDRYYMIVKVFLMITPFIAYLYLSLSAGMGSLALPELLSREPKAALIFLIAMVNPYIAYLLNIAQKKLKEGDMAYVCDCENIQYQGHSNTQGIHCKTLFL